PLLTEGAPPTGGIVMSLAAKVPRVKSDGVERSLLDDQRCLGHDDSSCRRCSLRQERGRLYAPLGETISREDRAVTRRAVARSAYGAAARLDRERAALVASSGRREGDRHSSKKKRSSCT